MFKCECGKEFENSQSFNGHKSHCKIHLAAVGKLDHYLKRQKQASNTGRAAYIKQRQEQKQFELEQWAAGQFKCECCGKVMLSKFGSGRFCSIKCAQHRQISAETKAKIAQGIVNFNELNVSFNTTVSLQKQLQYNIEPNYCKICGKELPYQDRHRRTCGNPDCVETAFQEAGKHSSATQTKRSAAEVLFYDFCCRYFKDVQHNVAMFNGWDADVIINDIKYAVLWNGPWHYKKVFDNQRSSLDQIQNRDKIKIMEIQKAGYTPYIVDNSNNCSTKEYVEKEFIKFLTSIGMQYNEVD